MLKNIVVAVICSPLLLLNLHHDTETDHTNNDSVPGSSYMNLAICSRDFVAASIYSGYSSGSLGEYTYQYFRNLHDYSPMNSCWSCGYVSFIQYLSYYDSFHNDTIIPEQYERSQGTASSIMSARNNSPGVIQQGYPQPGDGTSDFYNFVVANKDSDFQMQLMYIVNQSFGRGATDYTCSIGMWDYYRIINSMPALNSSLFTYTKVSDFGLFAKPTDANVISWFDSYVKGKIDQCVPVMLHIARYQNGEYCDYHSVVAYYYDSSGIHANFGWGLGYTDMIIDPSYSDYQITEAGVLDFSSVAEMHSNNFVVGANKYCGCGIEHAHNYTYSYQRYTASKHKKVCYCGDEQLEVHSVNPLTIYSIGVKRYGNCSKCNAVVSLNDTPVIDPTHFEDDDNALEE